MTQAIIQEIRTAKVLVSKTIDLPIKVAYALLRLKGEYAVDKQATQKTAMSARDINRAVEQHFRDREMMDPPDIDFGKMIFAVAEYMGVKSKLSPEAIDMMATSLAQNILTGMNLDTGAVYSQGDLANRIREMRSKGMSEREMQNILGDFLQKTFLTKLRYDLRREHTVDDVMTEDGEKIELVDKAFSLNPLSRSQASKWMSLVQQDSTLRLLLEKVDKLIERSGDLSSTLVWKALQDNPDYKSVRQLGEESVTFMHPTLNRPMTTTLQDALTILRAAKLVKTDNIRYIMENRISRILEKLKPVVLEALRERDVA